MRRPSPEAKRKKTCEHPHAYWRGHDIGPAFDYFHCLDCGTEWQIPYKRPTEFPKNVVNRTVRS